MRNKIVSIFVFLFFSIVFVIFFKGLKETNIYTPDLDIKKEIPFFHAKDFYTGQKLNTSDIFKLNQTYLLNIWSSWCVPCRKEHPLLLSLNENKKINIIGMNYKDNKINAEKFLKELGNPYKRVFVDLEGTIAIEWGAYGVPETFLIYNNKIIRKYIGPLNLNIIEEIKLLIK